jgi:4'-phosphopantetheinyl transferase
MPLGRKIEVNDRATSHPVLLEWHDGAAASELDSGAMRVWVVDLDSGSSSSENNDDALELPIDRLPISVEEKVRAARFVRARDRRRFVRSRVALREILGQLLGVSAGAVRFCASRHGKPELDWADMTGGTANERAIRFNVSHSAALALVAVASGREVGIDVEMIRPISEADRIVASYFTPAELAAFSSVSDVGKAEAFMRGWTRKEAVLKGLGVGLAGLAAQHETWFGSSELLARFVPTSPLRRVGEWYLWEAAPRPGYVAALAERPIS